MKDIGKNWAGTYLMWTELVPQRVWRGAAKPLAIDKARRKVNAEMSCVCRDGGCWRVAHPGITYKDAGFFRGDGVHLSTVGMEMYLMSSREAVAAAPGVAVW